MRMFWNGLPRNRTYKHSKGVHANLLTRLLMQDSMTS